MVVVASAFSIPRVFDVRAAAVSESSVSIKPRSTSSRCWVCSVRFETLFPVRFPATFLPSPLPGRRRLLRPAVRKDVVNFFLDTVSAETAAPSSSPLLAEWLEPTSSMRETSTFDYATCYTGQNIHGDRLYGLVRFTRRE